MADEDKKLALAAPLLPQDPPPPIPAAQLVSVWALLTAAILLGSIAFAFALAHHDIDLPSWMLPRAGRLTDAAEAEMGALNHWIMWSSAAQAAVAAAALLLPGSWSGGGRRALAYAAFASTITSHLMVARVFALLLTADLNIYSRMTVYFDMFFFM